MVADISDPFFVDYAPTGQASCKTCGRGLEESSVRLARRVRSPWHDGFDIQYNHPKCRTKFKLKHPSEIAGVEDLKFKDIMEFLKSFDIQLDQSHPVVQEFIERNKDLWNVRETFAKTSLPLLKKILEMNGYENLSSMKAAKAVFLVADGLLYGRTPKCPLCDQHTLEQIGTQWRCQGYLGGSSARCSFKYQLANLYSPDETPKNEDSGVNDISMLTRTEAFIIPIECQKTPALKNWKPPKTSAHLLGSEHSIKTEVQESEDEKEEDVPKGKELLGFEFGSIGATIPCRQDLIKLIEEHGGTYVETLTVDTAYFLVKNGGNSQSTKRYSEAIKLGIPILDCLFVPALCERNNVFPDYDCDKTRKRAAATTRSKKALNENLDEKEIKTETSSKKRKCAISKTESSTTTTKIKEECIAIDVKTRKSKRNENTENNDNDKKPKGLILRQRKYAKYYLIEGHMPPVPFPTVKSLLGEKSKNKSEKQKLVKRPRIDPGAPILQVDPLYPNLTEAKRFIYVDKRNNAYNAPTIFLDLELGINKYYNLQLIYSNDSSHYVVFRKWGRVGAHTIKAQNDIQYEKFADLDDALYDFHNRFERLTGLDWEDRFKPAIGGRYKFIQLECEADRSNVKSEDGSPEQKINIIECKLESHLKAFIEAIFDRRMMEDVMVAQELDMTKMPLGMISKVQMREGYNILQTIHDLLHLDSKEKKEENEDDSSPSSSLQKLEIGSPKWKTKITAATTAFYTTIPHKFSIKQTPPLLDTPEKLIEKIHVLEQLMEISIADSIVSASLEAAKGIHKLDAYYKELDCTLSRLRRNDDDFQRISRALLMTHAATHTGFSVKIRDIFKCQKDGELERYKDCIQQNNLDNRRLLWHGSRMTNWVGVLKSGLRIAPKEAPVSGYMFDKGVYFADMASKSCQYCYANSDTPEGVLVLCEVALGKPYMRLSANSSAADICKEEECFHTWGIGKTTPDPKDNVSVLSTVDNTPIILASGSGISAQDFITNLKKKKQYERQDPHLLYNEFVVYDTAQILMQYIIRIHFSFKSFDDTGSVSSSSSSSITTDDEQDDKT